MEQMTTTGFGAGHDMNILQHKQLGISWVQGEFSACLLGKSENSNQDYYLAEVDSLESFESALQQTIQTLDAKGADVSIVYEGHELSHPFVQVPPLSDQDFIAYIANRAQQESMSDEPILYSFRKSLQHHNRNGALIHIIQKSFVDEMIRICQKNHVFPVKLIPLSEIMALETFRFHPDENEILLMIAIFNNVTEILATRSDGKMLFLRDLNHRALEDSIDRLTTEIKRSMLYANQQFDADIKTIALIGQHSDTVEKTLQQHFDIHVESSDVSTASCFWAKEAALISPAIHSNLLPIQYQFERKGIFFKRAIKATIAITFLISGILSVQTELDIQANASNHLSPLVEGLLKQKSKLDYEISKVRSVQEQVQELERLQIQPIAGWFLSKLPDLLPQQLLLTSADIKYERSQWNFTLYGEALTQASQAPQHLKALETRISQLSTPTVITQSWREKWFQSIQKGGSKHINTRFEIKGSLQ